MELFFALLATLEGFPERGEADIKMIERIVSGDESALAELYTNYCKLLFSLGMRILRSAEDTNDLLQEVFLQIWNKAALFEKSKGSVYTWMVTLTRNRAIDRLRSKG